MELLRLMETNHNGDADCCWGSVRSTHGDAPVAKKEKKMLYMMTLRSSYNLLCR